MVMGLMHIANSTAPNPKDPLVADYYTRQAVANNSTVDIERWNFLVGQMEKGTPFANFAPDAQQFLIDFQARIPQMQAEANAAQQQQNQFSASFSAETGLDFNNQGQIISPHGPSQAQLNLLRSFDQGQFEDVSTGGGFTTTPPATFGPNTPPALPAGGGQVLPFTLRNLLAQQGQRFIGPELEIAAQEAPLPGIASANIPFGTPTGDIVERPDGSIGVAQGFGLGDLLRLATGGPPQFGQPQPLGAAPDVSLADVYNFINRDVNPASLGGPIDFSGVPGLGLLSGGQDRVRAQADQSLPLLEPIPQAEAVQEFIERQLERVPLVGQPLGLLSELVIPTTPIEGLLGGTGLGLAGDIDDVTRLMRLAGNVGRASPTAFRNTIRFGGNLATGAPAGRNVPLPDLPIEAARKLNTGTPVQGPTGKFDVLSGPGAGKPGPGRPIAGGGGPQLPANLQGSKPRYSFRDKNFTIIFEDDVDKAAYIATTRSTAKTTGEQLARRRVYRKWLSDTLGMSDSEIDSMGAAVRERLKVQAASAPSSGQITIKGSFTAEAPKFPRKVDPPGRVAGAGGEDFIPGDTLPTPKDAPLASTRHTTKLGDDFAVNEGFQSLPQGAAQIQTRQQLLSAIDNFKTSNPAYRNLDPDELTETFFRSGAKDIPPGTTRESIARAIGANEDIVQRAIDADMVDSSLVAQMVQSGDDTVAPGIAKYLNGQADDITDDEFDAVFKWLQDNGQGGAANRLKDARLKSKEPNLFLEILGLPRTMLATGDLSRALRQDITLMRHPEYWKTIPWEATAYVNPAIAKRVDDAITSSPWFKLRKRFGSFHAVTDAPTLREEAYFSRIPQKIPVFGGMVRGSERAFVTGGNKLRHDIFVNYAETWAREMGIQDDWLAKYIAGELNPGSIKVLADYDKKLQSLSRYLDYATGRGPWFKGTSQVLQAPFFAPRFLTSKPAMFVELVRAPWRVKGVIAADMASFVGGLSAAIGLAHVAGADIEFDPRSADFLKARFGKQRIDLSGGWAPLARQLWTLQSGETKAASGAIYEADFIDLAARYASFKMNPTLSLLVSGARGQDVIGREVNLESDNLKRLLFETFTPLFIQDVAEAIDKKNIQAGLYTGPLAFFGAGSNTYDFSDGEKLNELIKDMGFTDETTGEPITQWFKLSKEQQDAARELSEEVDELRTASENDNEIRTEQQALMEAAFDSYREDGNIYNLLGWIDTVSDEIRGQYDDLDNNELLNPGTFNKKISDFFDEHAAVKLNEGPEAANRFWDEFEAGLNAEEADAFQHLLLGSPSQDYEMIKTLRQSLEDTFYPKREEIYQSLRVSEPLFQPFETYEDVLDNGGLPEKVAGPVVNVQMQEYRRQNQSIDAIYYILGRSSIVYSQGAADKVREWAENFGVNLSQPYMPGGVAQWN